MPSLLSHVTVEQFIQYNEEPETQPENWQELQVEFADLVGTAQHKGNVILYREIQYLTGKLNIIAADVELLKLGADNVSAWERLRYYGIPLISVTTIPSYCVQWKIELKNKTDEWSKLQTGEGVLMDRTYFEDWLLEFGKDRSHLRTTEVTVFQFARLMNRYFLKNKM